MFAIIHCIWVANKFLGMLMSAYEFETRKKTKIDKKKTVS